MNLDRYYDKLMGAYYKVLVNTWDGKRKEALRTAISMLSSMPRESKVNERMVLAVEDAIAQVMMTDFGMDINKATRGMTEQSYRIGLTESRGTGQAEVRDLGVNIGFGGMDSRYEQVLNTQNLFWLQNHHQDGLGKNIMDMTATAMREGLTYAEYGAQLKTTFEESVKGSVAYYEKLALHSMQKVREIGKITGYEKAGATAYQILAVMDEKTSDICIAMNGKVFPLQQAIQTRDAMLSVDLAAGPEAAKEYLKEVSPWIKESQIVYNNDNVPIGVDGAFTPFPPFHWGCRTTTVMIYE